MDEVNNKSVSCTNIPEIFLDKNVATKYFNQYGQIHSFTLRPKRFSCTIEYETADEARAAINSSRSYNGQVFEMFYTPKERPKSRAEMDIIDPDVQSELDAMAGRGVMTSINRGSVIDLVSDSPIRRTSEIKVPPPIETKFASRQTHRSPKSVESKQLTQVDLIAKAELESILKRQSFTSEEKFRVLDARDKLIRLTRAQTKDIKNVVKMRGICPDMCPEKERLMREAKHQIAVYESDESSKNIINHELAIKQYSRSSADQEAPLLHELRPEPVLKMTLNYMLHRIVDLCDSTDVNLSDWFHFLWDRTRAIRKDITQQEFCSQTAVSLIEQCARFHIHCSARLVAEEPQVFDQKINTENLTKCLQSLKYMYHDLNLKNERCPNEAEFRAYVVLLNLHDSNFLWEVKQLPSDILQSKEIRFAINVYLAMESNNYVKFFQLVRQTTYMNACILLRYFVQVRVRALNVMVKSYVPRAPVPMSISYWSYILAFEDFEQCAQFLEYYGLQCDRNDDRVLLDRQSFCYPDLPILIDRAINVVEHKRECSVGEVIHGSELESLEKYEKHEPHNSFNDAGYLNIDAYTADDQNYYRPSNTLPQKQSIALTFIDNHHQTSTVKQLTINRQNDEMNLFKIPQSPIQMKNQSKSSNVFAKLSPRATSETDGTSSVSIFGKSIADKNATTSPSSSSSSSNIFRLPNDIDSVPKSIGTSKNIFQLPSTLPESSSISGTSNNSSNIFAIPLKPDNSIASSSNIKNIFQLTAPQFNDRQSTGLFSSFLDNKTSFTSASKLSTNFAAKSIDSPEFDTNHTTVDAISQDDKEKQRISMETEAKQHEIKRQEAELKRKEEELKIIEKQLNEERYRLIIDSTSNAILIEITNEFIASELTKLAINELSSYQQIIAAAEKIYNDIIINAVNEFIDATIQSEINNKTKEYLMFEYFWRWRINVRGRIEKRQKIERLECTPVWLPDTVSSNHISQLAHPSQHNTIAMRKRYLQGTANPILLSVHKDRKIDVFDIVPQHILSQTSSSRSYSLITPSNYWKCLISLPDATEDALFMQRYDKWLNGVFKRRFECDMKYFFCEQLHGFKGSRQSIAISMRKFIGTQLINESKRKATKQDVTGANGIIFLVSMAGDLDESHERLKSILKIASSGPVAIIIYNHDNVHVFDRNTICHKLNIDQLPRHHCEIDYFYCDQFNAMKLTDLMEMSIKFIASEYRFESLLLQQSSVSFLNQCLSDQFWKRISTSAHVNPGLYKAVTNPNFIINLYNTAIDRLIDICTRNINNHPEFPYEFKQFIQMTDIDIPHSWEYFPYDWKLLRRQKQWKTFLNELKLTTMTHCNLDNFESIQENILMFCQHNIPDDRSVDLIACQAIACIIRHIKSFNSSTDDVELTQMEKMEQFSWLPIIQLVAVEALTLHHKHACNENRLPQEIIYNRNELSDYTLIPWWLQQNGLLKNVRVDTESVTVDADNSMMIVKKPRIQRIDDDELMEILQRSAKSVENAERFIANSKEHYDQSKKISKNFDQMLYEQERDIRVKKLEWQISTRKENDE